MKKIRITDKKGAGVLSYKISGNQKINEWSLLVTGSDKQKSFLPAETGKDKKTLTVSLEGHCSLKEYLPMVSLTEKSFFHIVRGIINCVAEAERIRFSRHSILLNPEFVMIRPSDMAVKLIYIPVDPFDSGGSLKTVLEYAGLSAVFSENTDQSFLERFMEITQESEADCYMDMDEFVSDTADVNEKNDADINCRRCPICGTVMPEGGICTKCSSDTSVSDAVRKQTLHENKPAVFRSSSSETVMIDRFPFRIGKSPSSTDYRIDNRYVSGLHAEIILENKNFYITDRGSTNGTFLNGKKITPFVRYLLNSSDEFVLGNERFIFRLL